jgi:hypothetical protein
VIPFTDLESIGFIGIPTYIGQLFISSLMSLTGEASNNDITSSKFGKTFKAALIAASYSVVLSSIGVRFLCKTKAFARAEIIVFSPAPVLRFPTSHLTMNFAS